MMKKGDVVKIKATVSGISSYPNKRIIKRTLETIERTGIVLGYSFLKTGIIREGRYYDESNYLDVEQSLKVIVVEPLESCKSYTFGGLMLNNRYLEPVRCFEEDLELLRYCYHA